MTDTSGEQRALSALDALGLDYRRVSHGRVGSLAEAALARGVEPADVIKSIVVRRADDDYLFVLVPGDRTISWPKLRALLGVSRLSMPDAATALAVTGYERGTITPVRIAPGVARRSPTSAWAGARSRWEPARTGWRSSSSADAAVAALGAIVADVTEPE